MKPVYTLPAFLPLFILLAFLTACSSSSTTDDGVTPGTKLSDQYINATLDDKPFTGEAFGGGRVYVMATSTLGANALQLSATQGNQYLTIHLVGFVQKTGTFILNGLGRSAGDAVAYYSADGKNWGAAFNVSAGTVTVTSVKDNYVEGTFEFSLQPTAYGTNTPGTGTKVFKKGSFRSKYSLVQ